MSIQYHGQNARLSEAVTANGLVFLAGMVPENTDADTTAQTRDVLAQIRSLAGPMRLKQTTHSRSHHLPARSGRL